MYATIQNRRVEILDGIPTLEEAQAAVGGLIETAIRIPTDRKGITVEVYCNEEGLCLGLPIQFVRGTDGSYLAGDFVIVGGDDSTGEWVGLTTEEIGSVFDHLKELAEDVDPAELGW
jgi:Domain of unknown function (DUF3846)